jgi:hypothetical protein
MLTSKRPQVDDVQYPRISSKILKGTSHKEVFSGVVAKVAMPKIV